ncbi:glycosyltransferase [Candidatus Parcubacteria bacterium]|nr:glycosyltransferase [Candidatus Parcubacteria bacterium]
MKILKIGTIDKSGGAAKISWSIKQFMEKRGNKVSMFVADKTSTDSNVFKIKRTVHRHICYLFSNDLDLFRTNWITKTKQYEESDIVHLHNLHGYYFNLNTLKKITSKKPTVWTLHDMWAITPHCASPLTDEIKDGFFVCKNRKLYPRIFWPNEKYLRWRKRSIYKKSNFEIVVPSKWVLNKVKRSVLKDKKIHLIYNGINNKIFKKENKKEIRKKLGLPFDKKIVLFVSDAHKNELKGTSFVEEIIKNNQRDDLIFISIGGYESKQKNCININKINDQKLLAQYYSAADIFLYPSLADTFGLVVAESMSCGTPVLSFETGGIPEIALHKENGYIARQKDSKDLQSGLEYLLNLQPEETETMSKKCSDRISHNFTEKIMCENYLNLYKKILNKYE